MAWGCQRRWSECPVDAPFGEDIGGLIETCFPGSLSQVSWRGWEGTHLSMSITLTSRVRGLEFWEDHCSGNQKAWTWRPGVRVLPCPLLETPPSEAQSTSWPSSRARLDARPRKRSLRSLRCSHLHNPWWLLREMHGCCWETFYIFAYCGLVQIPT